MNKNRDYENKKKSLIQAKKNNHPEHKQHKIPISANPKQRQIQEQSSTGESNKEEASRPDQILIVFPNIFLSAIIDCWEFIADGSWPYHSC
ncbi:hypothetical protein MA16_Dca018474 [Dendrobium catenatum]|uniref:Uncharacterized protein n=1 Tax=Dendrobium catenatum TaxID=906689 RepID=A0A2I0X6E4_9ASPA|nr:hypothetical protein MA16_Dca018474 [Dendrobium catenatum]